MRFFPLTINLSSAVMFRGRSTSSYASLILPLLLFFLSPILSFFIYLRVFLVASFVLSVLIFFLGLTAQFRSMGKKTWNFSLPFCPFFSLRSRFLSTLCEDAADLVLFKFFLSFLGKTEIGREVM